MIVSLVRWDMPHISAIEDTIGEKIVRCRTREEALSALPEADIVITLGGARLLDETLLDAAPKLRLVLSMSAGVDKLPVAALHARGISLCNAKGVFSGTIAEYVLGGMLAVSHHFPALYRNQSRALWEPVWSGDDLDGKTLLIVGAGSIGGEIARRAKAFDMTVMGLRRRPEPAEHFDAVLGTDALHGALPRADYVVLAVPLTGETRHLFGAKEFALMKKTAVFINIARGDTVDEEALIAALREKKIAGAVLDVFQTEPLSGDSPLWALDNVLVTPHSAGLSDNAERKTAALLCENIRRLRAGEPLRNQIMKGAAY
jgi:D-2-hydroxyacid dehydrogenase (NADP+)